VKELREHNLMHFGIFSAENSIFSKMSVPFHSRKAPFQKYEHLFTFGRCLSKNMSIFSFLETIFSEI